jgi:hypothetical protein
MTEPKHIAVVTDTPALIAVIRKRADEAGLSRQAIDELAELTNGHASKLLSLVPSKGIGLGIIWGLVEAVGMKITLVEDPDAMARIADFVNTRNESQVREPSMRSAARMKKKARLERLFNDPKYFNKLARKGGRARAKSLTPAERSNACRLAARSRWKAERERRRQTRNAPLPMHKTEAGSAS